MQSTAKDVPTYLEEAAPERRDALQHLRSLCLETLAGYEEGMEYGMPTYKRHGVPEIAFASQKNYISLYVLKQDVVDAHRANLQGLKIGKGCIRFIKPNQIDFDVVRSLLAQTVSSAEQPC